MNRFIRIASGLIHLIFVCLVLGSFHASALAQTDLNGYWDLHIPSANGDGTHWDTYFELSQSGEIITGRLIRWHHETPIVATFSMACFTSRRSCLLARITRRKSKLCSRVQTSMASSRFPCRTAMAPHAVSQRR